jgi:hypothetical protein
LQVPAEARRLVRKSAFAKMRNWSPANVTKLTKPGGKLAEAVTADGLIDLELAERLLAQRTNPARVPDQAQDLASSAAGPSFADAKTRRAQADAAAAEIQLERLRGRLVEIDGVRQAGADMGTMLPQLLEEGLVDAVARIRQAATAADAAKLSKPIAAGLCARIVQELERAVREVTADA